MKTEAETLRTQLIYLRKKTTCENLTLRVVISMLINTFREHLTNSELLVELHYWYQKSSEQIIKANKGKRVLMMVYPNLKSISWNTLTGKSQEHPYDQ